MCRDGEIGRHVRLKIWWTEMSVPVRLWLSVHKMSHSNNRLVRHPFKVEIRVRVPCVIRYNFIIFFTWWRWCNWLAYRTVTAKLTVRFRHDTQIKDSWQIWYMRRTENPKNVVRVHENPHNENVIFFHKIIVINVQCGMISIWCTNIKDSRSAK